MTGHDECFIVSIQRFDILLQLFLYIILQPILTQLLKYIVICFDVVQKILNHFVCGQNLPFISRQYNIDKQLLFVCNPSVQS